jgi:hypothetical protein
MNPPSSEAVNQPLRGVMMAPQWIAAQNIKTHLRKRYDVRYFVHVIDWIFTGPRSL